MQPVRVGAKVGAKQGVARLTEVDGLRGPALTVADQGQAVAVKHGVEDPLGLRQVAAADLGQAPVEPGLGRLRVAVGQEAGVQHRHRG